jgi:hypothetical protein
MPNRLFVENCAIVRARALRQFGVMPNARTVVNMVLSWQNGRQTPLAAATLTTPSTIGPPKLWFACPVCQRRVGCLYSPSPDRRFACRRCWSLKYKRQYRSRRQTVLDLIFDGEIRMSERARW